jgi:hypothetical protein
MRPVPNIVISQPIQIAQRKWLTRVTTAPTMTDAGTREQVVGKALIPVVRGESSFMERK